MALKAAIVGIGGIGKNHARCYRDNPLSELVAICDIDKAKADAAAEEFGCRAFYDETEMLREMPEIDVVSVTTSGLENGSFHYEPAMIALDFKKKVLVEKPICADVRDAREMVNYALNNHLYLACDLNHYFTGPAADAKAMQDAGEVGELLYCVHKVGFNGGEANYGGAPAKDSRWNSPYAHLKAFCAHPFSVMRYFCGDITGVQAFIDRPGFRRSAEDPMLSLNSIHVRFANGGYGHLITQRGDAMFGYGGWWSYEHCGTKSTFAIENCVEKLYVWKPSENAGMATPAPTTKDYGVSDFGSTFGNRINAFLEDITNGVHPEAIRASGRDALATLEYTFAAIKSYENGGELVIPEMLPPIRGHVSFIK
ncbi:MAG: Gfo/Idh/MocA family oxidoreductase [Clostridia bacterium]|nr:Gfo/Idh/MocA family oxidoreductase [Clostridia bacterium]